MAQPSSSRVAIGIMGRFAARGPVMRIAIRGMRIRLSGSGLYPGRLQNSSYLLARIGHPKNRNPERNASRLTYQGYHRRY